MRGFAAIRAISSDWATPTRPSASASAHSGSASCRRAVWTRRCASGPDSLHMCFTTVFADRNPCLRNGFDRSTTPAAAIAAASTDATQHLDLFEPHPQLDGIQRRHIDIEQPRQRHRRPTDRITSPISRRPLHHRADEPQPDRIHTIHTGGSHHLVDVNRSHASIMTKGYPRVGETICPRERSPLAAPTTAQGVMTTLPTAVRSISERSASPARSSG